MLAISRLIKEIAGNFLSTAFTGVAALLVDGVMFMKTWQIYPTNTKQALGAVEMSKLRALVQAARLVCLA
jgi:hypothetical protein